MTAPVTELPRGPAGQRWLSALFGAGALAGGGAVGWLISQFGLAASAVLPAAGIFLSILAQPDLGLMALAFVIYTQLSNVLIKSHGLPSIAQPLNGLLLLIIILRTTLFGERLAGWQRPVLLLAALALPGLLSQFYALDPGSAQDTWVNYLKDALTTMIVFCLFQKPRTLRGLAWVFILACLLMGSVVSFQGATGAWSNNFWGFGNVSNLVQSGVSSHRLTGPFNDPNMLAYSLVIVIPLAFDRLLHERIWPLRLVALAAVSVSALAIVFTYSRGGFLALLLTVGLLIFQRRPQIGPLLAAGLLSLGLVSLIPPNYLGRLNTLTQFLPSQTPSNAQLSDSSFRGRTSENIAGWMMFTDHPLLGVGVANYPAHYIAYSSRIGLDPRRVERTPASLYLEILSEQGLLGSGLFVALLFICLRGLWLAPRRLASAGLLEESRLAGAMGLGIAVQVFSTLFRNSAYSNAFWLLIGLALAIHQISETAWRESRANRSASAPVA